MSFEPIIGVENEYISRQPPNNEHLVPPPIGSQNEQNAQHSSRIPNARMVGEVKLFDSRKKFGFINLLDGGDDIFVHASDIHSCNGIQTLRPKQKVSFILLESEGKYKAKEVMGEDGFPLTTTHVSRSTPEFAVRLQENPHIHLGTIKWFDMKRGYGFIVPEEASLSPLNTPTDSDPSDPASADVHKNDDVHTPSDVETQSTLTGDVLFHYKSVLVDGPTALHALKDGLEVEFILMDTNSAPNEIPQGTSPTASEESIMNVSSTRPPEEKNSPNIDVSHGNDDKIVDFSVETMNPDTNSATATPKVPNSQLKAATVTLPGGLPLKNVPRNKSNPGNSGSTADTESSEKPPSSISPSSTTASIPTSAGTSSKSSSRMHTPATIPRQLLHGAGSHHMRGAIVYDSRYGAPVPVDAGMVMGAANSDSRNLRVNSAYNAAAQFPPHQMIASSPVSTPNIPGTSISPVIGVSTHTPPMQPGSLHTPTMSASSSSSFPSPTPSYSSIYGYGYPQQQPYQYQGQPMSSHHLRHNSYPYTSASGGSNGTPHLKTRQQQSNRFNNRYASSTNTNTPPTSTLPSPVLVNATLPVTYGHFDRLQGIDTINPIDTTVRLGKVMWYSKNRKYGFLQCHDYPDQQIFVARHSIKPAGFDTLESGQMVEFITEYRPNGTLRALGVTGPRGTLGPFYPGNIYSGYVSGYEQGNMVPGIPMDPAFAGVRTEHSRPMNDVVYFRDGSGSSTGDDSNDSGDEDSDEDEDISSDESSDPSSDSSVNVDVSPPGQAHHPYDPRAVQMVPGYTQGPNMIPPMASHALPSTFIPADVLASEQMARSTPHSTERSLNNRKQQHPQELHPAHQTPPQQYHQYPMYYQAPYHPEYPQMVSFPTANSPHSNPNNRGRKKNRYHPPVPSAQFYEGIPGRNGTFYHYSQPAFSQTPHYSHETPTDDQHPQMGSGSRNRRNQQQ